MINTHGDLELLMARAEQCREAQQNYFRHRAGPSKKTWLAKSLEAEKQLDQVLLQLRRKGYDTTKFKHPTEQKDLF